MVYSVCLNNIVSVVIVTFDIPDLVSITIGKNSHQRIIIVNMFKKRILLKAMMIALQIIGIKFIMGVSLAIKLCSNLLPLLSFCCSSLSELQDTLDCLYCLGN